MPRRKPKQSRWWIAGSVAVAVVVIATVLIWWFGFRETGPLQVVWQKQHVDTIDNAGRKDTINFLEMVFAPDGARLATFGEGGRLVLWNARTGAVEHSWRSPGGGGLAFSADGQRLLVLDQFNRKLKSWRVADGSEESSVALPPPGRDAPKSGLLSPDGQYLATTNLPNAGAVTLWKFDASTGKCTPAGSWKAHGDEIAGIGFTADARHLWTHDCHPLEERSGQSPTLWEVPSGTKTNATAPRPTGNTLFDRLAISCAGQHQAVYDQAGGKLQLYAAGQLIGERSLGTGRSFAHSTPLQPSKHAIDAKLAAFSPDGRFLAVFDGQRRINVLRFRD